MDGHHKLIKWGIVIHGFTDRYDQMLFLRAVQQYGTPSRVRGDRGGENIEVSVWTIKYRGLRFVSVGDFNVFGSSMRKTLTKFIPKLERYGGEDNLDLAIAGDQDRHIRHEAIDVVENECPFSSEDATVIFSAALPEVKSAGIITENFGVAGPEWEERFYGETETVKIGREDVEIVLPFGIWW
ncbi:hypothetical protein B0H11DRAFT_1928679 [Mycena galericulata]|nr:hypothetical protein B0H11DRAFT_1928679 [Mycena galericulata]